MKMEKALSILGLDPRISPLEISQTELKRVYRGLVKLHHPDRFTQGQAVAESRMKDINCAYNVVSSFISSRSPGTRQALEDDSIAEKPASEITGLLKILMGEMARLIGRLFERRPRPVNEHAGERNKASGRVCRNRKQQRKFGDILKDAVKSGGDPSLSGAAKRGVGTGLKRGAYNRPRARSSSDTGPVGSIKPVSRVRGVGR